MKAIIIPLIIVLLIIAGCGGKTKVVVTDEETIIDTKETPKEEVPDEKEDEDTPQIKICSDNSEMSVKECEDSEKCTLDAWTCEEGDCPDGLYGYKCIGEKTDEPEEIPAVNQTGDETPTEPATTFITNENCVDGVISATFNNIWDSKITIASQIKVYSSGKMNGRIVCDKETIEPREGVICTKLGLIPYFDTRRIVVNHPNGKDYFDIDCSQQE